MSQEQYQELELQQQEEIENSGDKQLISHKEKGTKYFVFSTPMKIIALVILTIIILVIYTVFTETVQSGKNLKWINIKQEINTQNQDYSNYEQLVIPKNNLKIILITQNNLQLSGASLDIRAGSQNNPTEFPGLAHLLEHMLFMGSEKYPEEDAFNSLVSKSGGNSNAYTDSGNTNYHFQSTHNNFIEILNIWSRFFIDPLLLEDQLQREVKAVDSEYRNTLIREGFRDFNLLIDLSEDNHPFKIFSCGNTNSLLHTPQSKGLSTYNALRSFKRKYYFSENMTLVVKSDDSLREELKDKLESIFQDIPTRENNMSKYNETDEELIKYSYQATKSPPITSAIQSVSLENNKIKKLKINFLLENNNDYMYTSLDFVKDLFEYGFDGTNFCYLLEDRKLATECKIEAEESDGTLSSFLIFEIEMQFLQREDCIEEIVQSYFYFINSVANYPNKKEVYDEIKRIKKGLFNLMDDEDQQDVMDEVTTFSKQVNRNRTEDMISEGLLYKEYNEEHFSKIMRILTDPSKIVIIHKTSNSTFTQGFNVIEDKLNDLNYTKSEITSDKQLKLKQYQQLNIPKIQSISNFGEIKDTIIDNPKPEEDDKQPRSIIKNEKGRVYIFKDRAAFKKPMQQIYLKFQNSILISDIKSKAANQIMNRMLSKELKRNSHQLKLQGLKIDLESTRLEGGFIIQITCFNSQVDNIIQKVKESIDQVFSKLLSNPSIFEDFKQQQIDVLNNNQNQMLYQQFSDLLNSYLHTSSYSVSQILPVIKDLEITNIKQTIQQFLDQYFLTIYAFGDVDEEQIKKSFKLQTEGRSKRAEDYIMKSQYHSFKNKPTTLQLYFVSGDSNNSLCSNFYQIGKLSRQELAILYLIEKPLKSQAFNQLRTQLQLGYVVTSKVINNSGDYGVIILVQGSKHNPNEYDQYIEEFLPIFEQFLSELKQEDIDSMQLSLIQSLKTDKFDKFTDKAEHYWPYINEMSYDYSKNQELIQIIKEKQYTNKDLQSFFTKYFKNTNSRFSIQLFNPSRIKQSDLPIKSQKEDVYSGKVGTYITSKEEFDKQLFDLITFNDTVKLT